MNRKIILQGILLLLTLLPLCGQAKVYMIVTATNEQLTQFFTTTACTTLKDTYAGSSDADLHAAISGLPATVQNLIVKVKKDGWTTYGGWDKTERTFRIADYKAYSNFRRWTSILGLSYDLSYLDNPTGIYVDAGSYIQVYVGDIPEGQSVLLSEDLHIWL